jgi:hypothetical protein
MRPGRWTALAQIALAVGAVFFVPRGTHTDPENASGQNVGQAKNSMPSHFGYCNAPPPYWASDKPPGAPDLSSVRLG